MAKAFERACLSKFVTILLFVFISCTDRGVALVGSSVFGVVSLPVMSTGWFISPAVIVFLFPVTCLFFSVTFPLLLSVITLPFLLLYDVTLFLFKGISLRPGK